MSKDENVVEHVALSQMGGTFAERAAARMKAEKADEAPAEKAVQKAENKAVKKRASATK
jgi:hypothetical protein